MKHQFTLEYWQDDDWYVGKLKEVPGVFSQGETLEELEENIRDAYQLMMEDSETAPHPRIKSKENRPIVRVKNSINPPTSVHVNERYVIPIWWSEFFCLADCVSNTKEVKDKHKDCG
jgi:predicted RNase H-like HicB family nuclease